MSDYEASSKRAALAAVSKGHGDPENLRELLIWTTSTTTYDLVIAYFRQHLEDSVLVADLVSIALEGEDGGDAPWAAANLLEEFPIYVLQAHRSALLQLSKHSWSYLSEPATRALEKLGDAT
jgi:hypothetical protein